MDQIVQLVAILLLGLVGLWLFKVFFIGGLSKNGGYRKPPAIKGCAEGCMEMVIEACFPIFAIIFLILLIVVPIFVILLAVGAIRLSDLFK